MGTRWRLTIVYNGKRYNFFFSYDGYFRHACIELLMELNKLLNKDITLSEIKESLRSKSIIESTESRQNSEDYISSIFSDVQIYTDDCDDIEYEYVVDLDEQKFIIMSFDCGQDEYTDSHNILSRNLPRFSNIMTNKIDQLLTSGKIVFNGETWEIEESIKLEFSFDEII